MDINKLDFIAIGDTVVDAFIRLQDAHLTCNIDNTKCELCMAFGSKVPYESVTVIPAVGNSANAAVSSARLGLQTALVTYLGDDVNGRQCLFELEKEKIITSFIHPEHGKITNYHYVLWFQDERTILIKHESFKCHLPNIGTPSWIYLSSLGENTLELHNEISAYLKNNPSIKLAFQPGTFQMKLGAEALKDIYTQTEYFCCNVEESQKILNTESRDIKELLLGIKGLGPKIITITDGKNGAYLMTADSNMYVMPIYPDIAPPLERTGAGDAFTSTFAAMLALGKTPEEAITYAPINSMHVVQFVGAQKGLLNMHELEEYLAAAPADYKLSSI